MSEHKSICLFICDADKERTVDLVNILTSLNIKKIKIIPSYQVIYETAQKYPPDLVILGDSFPDATTLEIMQYLKIEPDLKHVPILLHATNPKPVIVQELIAEGLTDVIVDPPTVPTVKRALRNYFRRIKSQEITRLIREASFFAGFSKEELLKLAKIAIPRRYQAGEGIFLKEDPADHFCILLKGRIETLVLDSAEMPVAIRIEEGSPFGEMAILDNAPRSAYCIAAADSIILEIGSHIIDDSDDKIRLKIFAKLAIVLAERLRHMNALLKEQQAKWLKMVGCVAQQEESEEEPISSSYENFSENLFVTPTGTAGKIDPAIQVQEEYDVLKRKVNLRIDFITAKIPQSVCETVANKMYGYWTGAKLAKMNPHQIWSAESFTPSSTHLKRAFHIVVVCANGAEAYQGCFLQLPFTHRVVGLSQMGCTGTFLESDEVIENYLNGESLQKAISFDLKMPIDRVWQGKDCIEYLTHTTADVRPQTLFLVFDSESGKYTQAFREKFPQHQMVTIVRGLGFQRDDSTSLFTSPEERLKGKGLLVSKSDYEEKENQSKSKGFYAGQTVFLPDFSEFYVDTDRMRLTGYIFGTIGLFAKMGPDYSGVTWGSKGGAEGAVRAARAMYGLKGAQSDQELSEAVSWADN